MSVEPRMQAAIEAGDREQYFRCQQERFQARRRSAQTSMQVLEHLAARVGADEARSCFKAMRDYLNQRRVPREDRAAWLYDQGGFFWPEAMHELNVVPTGPARAAFFRVSGEWRPLLHRDAFQQALADAQPPLKAWLHVVDAFCSLMRAQPLFFREDVEAMTREDMDVRASPDIVHQWEPTRFDGRRLTFMANVRQRLTCVTIDELTHTVNIDERGKAGYNMLVGRAYVDEQGRPQRATLVPRR